MKSFKKGNELYDKSKEKQLISGLKYWGSADDEDEGTEATIKN